MAHKGFGLNRPAAITSLLPVIITFSDIFSQFYLNSLCLSQIL